MEVVTLNEICRACLTKTNNMVPLDSVEESISLKKKMSCICNFIVEINDVFPRFLCKECSEKLKATYDFQQLCHQSQEFITACIAATHAPHHSTKELSVIVEKEKPDQESRIVSPEEKKIESNLSINKALVDEGMLEADCKDVEYKADIQNQPQNNEIAKLSKHLPEVVKAIIDKVRAKFLTTRNCLYCDYTAKDCRVLSVHMTRVHRSKKSKWCSGCNAVYDNIKEHVSSFHKNEFKCPLCDKNCGNTSHFVEHVLRHSDTVEISDIENSGIRTMNTKTMLSYCSDCNKSVKNLNRHNTQFHKKLLVTNKYSSLCTLCGKQFRTKTKLSIHMQVHTGQFRFKCSHCDAAMSTRSNLIVHERIHTGEKPHICKVCGKRFAQTSVLNVHMKLHTGKSEQCHLCPKKFCRPSELRQHMRTHTGEKPYLCLQCGKAFKQRSHLVEHLNIHSNVRPYQCEFCEKSFKQIGTLNVHINLHLEKKPFQCTQCPYECQQRYSLKQHMRQHEKNKIHQENVTISDWNDSLKHEENEKLVDFHI